MKKRQVLKFWEALDSSTFAKETISTFKNKKGYGGKRTLERFAQAAEGFKEALQSEVIARKTGWGVKFVNKIRSWWDERVAEKLPESYEEPAHKQEVREKDEMVESGKRPAQFSLVQEAHFDEVKKYKETWKGEISGWSWRRLSDALLANREIPRLKDSENAEHFPKLQNHLREPKLWLWWEELKKAVTPTENEVDGLWKELLGQTQELTGLQLTPRVKEGVPPGGITTDFFLLILYEQEHRAIGEPSYYTGSRIYCEDSVVDTSVEEGLAYLRSEHPKQLLPTMFVSGGARVISEDARVVEKRPQPAKGTPAVRFFLRFAHQEIAFVEDDTRLAKVREVHEQFRGKYGQKLTNLVGKSEQSRKLIQLFVDELGRIEISRELHPCCPDFGRWGYGRRMYADEILFELLTLAREEAEQMNHNSVCTEHILLGLVREDEGTVSKVLANLGVSPAKLRSAIEYTVGRGENPSSGEIELAPSARRAVELAIDEARQLGHDHVGPEHVLLGLLRQEEELANRRMKFFKRKNLERFATSGGYGILRSFGINLDQARTEVKKLLSTPPNISS